MKTKLFIKTALLSLAVAAPLFLVSALHAQTPVGNDWDLISSGGGQNGITFLSFTKDFSNGGLFTGYVLTAGKASKKSDSGDGRNPGGGVGRDPNDTGMTATTSNSFLFGFTPINGQWSFDIKGRVIGFFSEVINQGSATTNYNSTCPQTNVIITVTNADSSTYLDSTNLTFPCFSEPQFQTNFTFSVASTNDGTINNYSRTFVFANTNFTVIVGSGEVTNAVSFVGKAVAGKRLTLKASTSFGNVYYRGVPFRTNLNDLAGDWYGTLKKNKQSFIEFFNLSQSEIPNIYTNGYGIGPGYTFEMICVLSAQKKIGFAFLSTANGSTNGGTLGATVGSFKASATKGLKATTKGIEEPTTSIHFDATLPPSP